jgi:hypothetical protein
VARVGPRRALIGPGVNIRVAVIFRNPSAKPHGSTDHTINLILPQHIRPL